MTPTLPSVSARIWRNTPIVGGTARQSQTTGVKWIRKQLTLYYLRMPPMVVVPTMCVVAMVTVTMVMITSCMVVAMVHVVSVVMLVSMVTVTMVMMTTSPMMEDKDTDEIHQEPQNRDYH